MFDTTLTAFAVLCTAMLTSAHPGSMICNDPRLTEGGNMMHAFVTINNHQTDLLLEANATQYKYGETILITIKANGTRYVSQDAPMGVYLALQVKFTGPNGEAMGTFHDASPDLDLPLAVHHLCSPNLEVNSPANLTFTGPPSTTVTSALEETPPSSLCSAMARAAETSRRLATGSRSPTRTCTSPRSTSGTRKNGTPLPPPTTRPPAAGPPTNASWGTSLQRAGRRTRTSRAPCCCNTCPRALRPSPRASACRVASTTGAAA